MVYARLKQQHCYGKSGRFADPHIQYWRQVGPGGTHDRLHTREEDQAVDLAGQLAVAASQQLGVREEAAGVHHAIQS